MSERDWNAELRAIWKHRAEWIAPHGADEDERGWSIVLQHGGGHETVILCFDDAEYDDDDGAHRSRSMHPRLAALVDERAEGSA